jgi:hypothetical protein
LLAHLPWKEYNAWDFKGHVEGIPCAPHFAQPNSIEYEPALEWRQKEAVHQHSKQLGRKRHVQGLEAVMRVMEV